MSPSNRGTRGRGSHELSTPARSLGPEKYPTVQPIAETSDGKKKCRFLQFCFCLKELLRPPLEVTRLKLVRESGTWGGFPPDLSPRCWQQVTEGKQCLSASPPREARAPFQPVHPALSLESWQLGNSCRLACFV